MSLTRRDVEAAARLAEIEVAEAELPRLVAELDRIVDYVGQLAELPDAAGAVPVVVGPAAAPLRADRVESRPLARPPAALAPEFDRGFFLVPRLPGLEDQ